MHLNVAAANALEWLALKLNLVPLPLIHTQLMPLLSQAVLEVNQIGLFDYLEQQPRTGAELSQLTNTNTNALEQILGLLASGGYLRIHRNKYRLTAMARKFCLRSSPYSLFHQQQFNHACQLRWQEHLGQYLKTGQGLESHHTFTSEEWKLYQQGMNTLPPKLIAQMVAPLPLPDDARTMLDIGGAHGQYAQAFADRLPGLQVTVLDLPEALALAPAGRATSTAITYLGGNALTYNYPLHQYDIIFISNLLHHFDLDTAATLCMRAKRGLKPGGIFIIQEFLKPSSLKPDFAAAALDLYFSLTSSAGCYTLADLLYFIQSSGCVNPKHRKVWQMPGLVQIWGKAPI